MKKVVEALERDNFMDADAAKDWGLVDEIVENRPRDEDAD
jgi:ATP-dependent Clp protease protease subunit